MVNKSEYKNFIYDNYLGIFKNNQAQVDEYLTILNPLLRRTTEGNINPFLIKECFPEINPHSTSS